MKQGNSKLYFYTSEYPFSSGEAFIENEIDYLASAFSGVILFPFNRSSDCRDLPGNAHVVGALPNSKLKLSDAFLIVKVLVYEFLHMNNKLFFLKEMRTWISILKQSILLSRSIEDIVCSEAKNNNITHYSFWMNEWSLALAILKDRGVISHFVFRCGGYDIWDERHKGKYLPFRFYTYKMSSGIYPNSKMGEIYLKKYNHYPEKINCLYWGTKDRGMNPFNGMQTPCIVSCSSLIPLKRVDKIVDILMHFDFELKWVHFGDGPLKRELLEKIERLPSNITVELKGNVRNSVILDYYASNSVSCFISTSSTESLPVSIQEAISFGIPVVGTNVGGVSEIVNDLTGLLLEPDFAAKKIAPVLKEVLGDRFSQMIYRERIRSFWFENFSAENNYTEFVKILKTPLRK